MAADYSDADFTPKLPAIHPIYSGLYG